MDVMRHRSNDLSDPMPLWVPPIVAEQPGILLISWAAFDVRISARNEPTLHLVGYVASERGGRVTSPVVELNVPTLCAVTESGRMYRLVGAPGLNLDAEYVWECWKRISNVTVLRDATQSIVQKFRAAGGVR